MRTLSRSARSHAVTAATILLMVALAASIYWPGLYGAFLFDDFANLPSLGRYGGVHDFSSLSWYLTSGIADPTGRPVAMLSFLIDARDWPADPFSFKRTNLIIHLCNGLVLYSVLSALGQRLTSDLAHLRTAALLATAIWLLHPLWTSTVLYVIQRHAMLATLFVLAGMRSWIASREAFDAGRTLPGWGWAILAVPVFGLLAGLSKANGFLLPLLLAVLQITVLRPSVASSATTGDGHAKLAVTALVWIPSFMLVTLLAWNGIQGAFTDTSVRPWTIGQRLLTQPRALCDYLKQLLVPGLDATGVFADGFPVSRTWSDPRTTLPALVAISILATVGWSTRHKSPVLASALLFFLAGHTMESSVVMLELYFEHRNYLPAALLFWPLAWWLAAPGLYLRWRLVAGTGFLALCVLATATQARLWSDPLVLALTWAQQHPLSARAQTYAAQQERTAGRDDLAEQRLAQLLADNPDEPQYALSLLNLRCDRGYTSHEDVEQTARALANSGGVELDINYHWLAATLRPGHNGACSGLNTSALATLLEAATEKVRQDPLPKIEMRSRQQNLIALFALRRGHCAEALAAFNRRVDIQRRPEFVHTQTGMLATHCDNASGLAHLEHYLHAGYPDTPAHSPVLRLRDWLMRRDGYWQSEWQRLRPLLQESAPAVPDVEQRSVAGHKEQHQNPE